MEDRDYTRRASLARLAEHAPAEVAAPPAVTVPIDASGSGTAVLIRGFLFQIIIAAGTFVSVMGLGERSEIVKWLRFFQREEAVPIITAIAAAGAMAWDLVRRLRKHRSLQTVTLLPTVPDSVAVGPENPPAAVAAAVEAAVTLIDQQGAAPARLAPTKGL